MPRFRRFAISAPSSPGPVPKLSADNCRSAAAQREMTTLLRAAIYLRERLWIRGIIEEMQITSSLWNNVRSESDHLAVPALARLLTGGTGSRKSAGHRRSDHVCVIEPGGDWVHSPDGAATFLARCRALLKEASRVSAGTRALSPQAPLPLPGWCRDERSRRA